MCAMERISPLALSAMTTDVDRIGMVLHLPAINEVH